MCIENRLYFFFKILYEFFVLLKSLVIGEIWIWMFEYKEMYYGNIDCVL